MYTQGTSPLDWSTWCGKCKKVDSVTYAFFHFSWYFFFKNLAYIYVGTYKKYPFQNKASGHFDKFILQNWFSFVTSISLYQLVLLDALQLATGATGLFSQGVTAVVHGCSVRALGHNFGRRNWFYHGYTPGG